MIVAVLLVSCALALFLTYRGGNMIVAAVICTLLGGVLGAFLEPVSLAISIPIAIMGGFILKAVRDSKRS